MNNTDKILPSPSFRPLYEQIKLLLTDSLIAGEWRPGEAIPSEIELAARYRVSQGTVRKAIDALAAENILVRRQGKGTFVATHTEVRHQMRFLRIVANSGEKDRPESSYIDFKRGKANAQVAQALGLRPGAPVFVIARLLVFSGRPVVLDEICVSAARFRGLSAAKLNDYKGSIYSLYETYYGLRMVRAEEWLRAVPADEFAAAQLRVARGSPLLCVDRIAYTYGDKPVEWRHGLCHTDGHSYYNELA